MSVTEMLNTPSMAFYVPSCNTVYAWARQQDGEWVTEYGAKTLNAVRRIYPDTELLSFSGVKEAQNRGYRRQWVEVSEARYIDQLEVLPPLDWCRGFGGESFKSREFTGGDVTAIFVSVEGRFFECHDLHTLKHKALIEDVITRFCPEKHLNSGH